MDTLFDSDQEGNARQGQHIQKELVKAWLRSKWHSVVFQGLLQSRVQYTYALIFSPDITLFTSDRPLSWQMEKFHRLGALASGAGC